VLRQAVVARARASPSIAVRLGRALRESTLSLALIVMFLLSFAGQIAAGKRAYEDEQRELRSRSDPSAAEPTEPLTLGAYLHSGHFLEATFENWESEFLQMGVLVLLTIKLRQRGSSESKGFDGAEEVDEDPRARQGDPNAPWPVRRGGWVLKVYAHSLSIALFSMFALAAIGHAFGGAAAENARRAVLGLPRVTIGAFVASADFWFQSLQNWQSEFLSVAVLIVLSIFLRERGSSQSKPVGAPHSETGE
jgi:hypothetical protein